MTEPLERLDGNGLGTDVVVHLARIRNGAVTKVQTIQVDEETTGDVKASAQSLFNVVIVGVGIIVGSKIATGVADWVSDDGGPINYRLLFSYPMWASLACLLILLVFYPGGRRATRAIAPSRGADPGAPEAT